MYAVRMVTDRPEVVALWRSHARARLAAALDKVVTLLSIDDMAVSIADGSATLWDIRDEQTGESVASFVTEVVTGGLGSGVNVLALGGDGMEKWIANFSEAVALYAKQSGCEYVLEMGRVGWRRVLTNLGWEQGPCVMLLKVA